MTVFRNDLDAIRLNSRTDERVDVVVTNFTQQTHLLHRLASNLVSLGEYEIFGADHRATVTSNFGENLIHGHARQT